MNDYVTLEISKTVLEAEGKQLLLEIAGTRTNVPCYCLNSYGSKLTYFNQG